MWQGKPVTIGLIILSVLATLWIGFGENLADGRMLLISEVTQGAFLYEISHGQVWRLITPIFLHFSILHILFNMMWLWQLGGVLEQVLGWRKYLIMLVVMAALSNVAEYIFSGPLFGGMSGVVYGLFSYVWLRGRRDPRFPLRMPDQWALLMLVWYVLCWSGLLGHIANMAHTVGAVVGLLWAMPNGTRRRV